LSKNIYEIEIYDFEILGLLKEAYRRSDGVKAIFLTAIFTYIVIALLYHHLFDDEKSEEIIQSETDI
jgi:hypothetical protein